MKFFSCKVVLLKHRLSGSDVFPQSIFKSKNKTTICIPMFIRVLLYYSGDLGALKKDVHQAGFFLAKEML